MQGWIISSTTRANRHWQSGSKKGLDLLNVNSLPRPIFATAGCSLGTTPPQTVVAMPWLGMKQYVLSYSEGVSTYGGGGTPCGRCTSAFRSLLHIGNPESTTTWYRSGHVKSDFPTDTKTKVWYKKLTLLEKPTEWKDTPLYVRDFSSWGIGYISSDNHAVTVFVHAQNGSAHSIDYNITGLDTRTYQNYNNIYQTYYKFDIDKPLVTKFTLTEAGQWNGNSIQGIDVAWLGYAFLTITPEEPQTESIELHGKMRIKYELLTESEYNAERGKGD